MLSRLSLPFSLAVVVACAACITDVTPETSPTTDPSSSADEGALGTCANATINGGRLLVAIEDGGAVTLNPKTGAILHRSSTGPNAFGAIYSPDGRAFVTDKNEGTLSEIDRETGAVLTTIDVGTTPQQPALAADGRMFIPLSGEAAVAVVDTSSSLSLLRKISIGDGTKPHIVSLSPDGRTLWVTVQGRDPKVVSINITATGEDAPKDYRYNLVPRVVDAADGHAWFTAHHSTGLHRVNLATGAVDTPYMDTFGNGSSAEKQIEGVDVTADGSLVALTHEGRQVAIVLDANSNAGGTVEKTFETQRLSSKPYWVTFDPSSDVIYVSIPGSGTVQAFSTTGCSSAPLWTANVGGKPKRMAVTTAGASTDTPEPTEQHVVYFGRQEVLNGSLKSALGRKPEAGEHVTLRFFVEEVASFVEGPYALATGAHLYVRFSRDAAFGEATDMPSATYMQRGPYVLWDESAVDVELTVPAGADRVEVFAYFDRTSWNGSTCYYGYDIMECPDQVGIDGAYVSNFGSNFRIGVD